MPTESFTISVTYLQGTLNGCIRVVVNFPSITIYRIPHDYALELSEEPDLKNAGIYLLLNAEEKTLYVGQADARNNGNGILGRMLETHSRAVIDTWDTGYALTSKTSSFFGATELNYLERFFYDEAKKYGRYTLLNGQRPHSMEIDLSTRMTLGNYIDFVFFLLQNQLQCDIFIALEPEERIPRDTPPEPSVEIPKNGLQVLAGVTLYIDSKKKDAHAEGILSDKKGIRVLKGSRISLNSRLEVQKRQGTEKLRLQLISDGIIKDRVFVRDYPFSSTSAAASVILGSSSSGMKEWKDRKGISIGTYAEKDSNENGNS